MKKRFVGLLFSCFGLFILQDCSSEESDKGACCMPDGTCEQTGYEECANLGGGFKGVPSSCSADPCTSYCGSDADCGVGMYCHSSGECREGCKTDPDTCSEGECDPADHTCKEPAYCSEMRSRIQAYVDWIIDNDLTLYAGLIIGIDTPDCGVSVHTTGLADMDQGIPLTKDHILPVASISKSFLAATVLQLVEEGRLSLEDTLSNWRTDIPNADIITVRQLINHTSGIFPYMGTTATQCNTMFLNDPDLVWTPEDLLDCIDGEQPRFEPGTDWEYSNTNYVLLGLIVEAITGNELHVEIRNRILDPLGLSHTFALGKEEVTGELARSYYFLRQTQDWDDITDDYNISFYWATGNLGSNAEDLLTWIRNLLYGSVLEESSLLELKDCIPLGDKTIVQDDFVESGYGLGLFCGTHDDAGDTLVHTGGYETAVAIMWHSLDWDTSVVIQCNRGMHNLRPSAWLFNSWSEVVGIIGEYR